MIPAALWAAGVVVALWAGVYVYAKWLERRFPPVGSLVDVGPGRLHCVDSKPQGRARETVLLVHGASGNFADLHESLAGPLTMRGFRVISVDRPGHGWSDRMAAREIATAPDRQAQWIRAALQRMGVTQAIVVVHSLAGALGLAMAADAPDFVAGLVLLAPASHPWPGGVSWYYKLTMRPLAGDLFRWLVVPWAAHLNFAYGLRDVFAPDPTPPDYIGRTRLPLMLRPWHFRVNAEDVVDLKEHVKRLRRFYGQVRAPTVIVTGDRDQVVYADIHSFGTKRDVPGATLVYVRGLGHSPHWTRPDIVVEAVERVSRGPDSAP